MERVLADETASYNQEEDDVKEEVPLPPKQRLKTLSIGKRIVEAAENLSRRPIVELGKVQADFRRQRSRRSTQTKMNSFVQ